MAARGEPKAAAHSKSMLANSKQLSAGGGDNRGSPDKGLSATGNVTRLALKTPSNNKRDVSCLCCNLSCKWECNEGRLASLGDRLPGVRSNWSITQILTPFYWNPTSSANFTVSASKPSPRWRSPPAFLNLLGISCPVFSQTVADLTLSGGFTSLAKGARQNPA